MSTTGKSLFVGSLFFTAFAALRPVVPLRNMIFYVLACMIFVLAAAASYLLLNRSKNPLPAVSQKVWSILPVALLAAWIVLFYINEIDAEHPLNSEDMIRRYFPFPLWITLMAVGVAICLFVLKKGPCEKAQRLRKWLRGIVALLFTLGTSIQFYAPNIFQDLQGGPYHSHAYTNSIINVCWLTPYSANLESLYGHYAILYMPFLKALHRFFQVDYLTGIFAMSAVIAGISILLFIYVLNHFAKSDLVFYLGMFAIGEEYFMLMQGGVFLQVHPHRMIFPIALIALALHEYKTGKKHLLLSILLVTLSFVWSTEVGIVIMLSFSLYRWIQLVMDGSAFSFQKILLLIREGCLYALLPFALSYVIICGYNLIAGGAILDFSEFMFPLISDRDYIDSIELVLPDITHAWIGSSILFLGTVCMVLFQIFFGRKKENRLLPFYFLLGVMSLGLMLYYINRPVEGCLFIFMFPMLILQAILLQKAQALYLEWKQSKESVFSRPDRFALLSLGVTATLILVVMAFDSVYSMPQAWKTSSETIWKRDELKEFADYIYVQVPPDAVSFGEGVPELMSLIDRDTHLHTTEWSIQNMPLDTMGEIRQELETREWFFCSLASLDYLQTYYPGLTDHFDFHEQFEYNGVKFAFFKAKAKS